MALHLVISLLHDFFALAYLPIVDLPFSYSLREEEHVCGMDYGFTRRFA